MPGEVPARSGPVGDGLKRLVDATLASAGLLVLSPALAGLAIAIWAHDRHSPFYVANRVAKGGGAFRMVKLRSMTVGADRTGVDSTSADDQRITPVGRLVRAYKLDELLQLWNVLRGDMSLVGPRPQVAREVALFTDVERRILDVRPGITDMASIVFADEGDILAGRPDPDLSYNQLIRPWKSRLALLYVERRSLGLDIQLVWLTLLGAVRREQALSRLQSVLRGLQADPETLRVAARQDPLTPHPPPGAAAVVADRHAPPPAAS
jgi:lipopolysaccharide/colanic/teichoic acid biosynthesis glycosyltransferase